MHEFIETSETRLLRSPRVAGYYDMGGLRVALLRLPTRWQRWWVKRLLGWTWRDA